MDRSGWELKGGRYIGADHRFPYALWYVGFIGELMAKMGEVV